MTDKDTPGNPPLLLRLPPEIGIPLKKDAKKQGITVQAVLLEIAAAHYGVEFEPPKRGGNNRKGKS